MQAKIMVFIPAYRCEEQIGRVLAQFTPEVAAYFSEIVVVENRSPDQTLQRAKEGLAKIIGCKTTLLQNQANYSLGGSHKVAFNYCIEQEYDYMVVLHGDDQGSITDLLPQLRAKKHEQFDSLLGARFMSGSKLPGYSWFRTFGNYVFNTMVSLATLTWIYDMGSGLNMYKASFLKSRFYMNFPDDLTFNVYMLYYSVWKKSSLRFFPLTWREDDQVSNAKIFKQAMRILGLTKDYVLNKDKLFMMTEQAAQKEYHSERIEITKSDDEIVH